MRGRDRQTETDRRKTERECERGEERRRQGDGERVRKDSEEGRGVVTFPEILKEDLQRDVHPLRGRGFVPGEVRVEGTRETPGHERVGTEVRTGVRGERESILLVP